MEIAEDVCYKVLVGNAILANTDRKFEINIKEKLLKY